MDAKRRVSEGIKPLQARCIIPGGTEAARFQPRVSLAFRFATRVSRSYRPQERFAPVFSAARTCSVTAQPAEGIMDGQPLWSEFVMPKNRYRFECEEGTPPLSLSVQQGGVDPDSDNL
jgi:hypothetical protein